ncbi:MAG TPA: isovaleryl-CoA dehydrogenase [Myxococcales bacterium]|nr:isovaleryl-CoA dehydrogenase [Myxococcales bacterium]
MPTHEVLNQPPPLEDYDPLARDLPLLEGLRREGAAWAEAEAGAFARATATREALAWGFEANRNPPQLRTHDRFGHRLDEVEFHPAWHELMRLSIANGVHAGPWRDPREGAHVARAAKMFLASQTEAGHGCPLSMTYSAFPALQRQPDLLEEWAPQIVSLVYDPRMLPAGEKRGALIGMGMTEKQGGSDVRANTTRAEPLGGGGWALTGHKWFCSAPMNDAFLVLAQAPRGLSCFLLPRWTPDGTRNRFYLQRLKDKLGNRSNASAEVEFDRSWARLVGEEGRGVATILEMVNHTRLDCVIGAAAIVRQALAQAIHHCRHRSAFGRRLIEQPLMREVLADLAIESEAATVLMMRLARSYDRREEEAAFRRIATAVAKYWVCKRAAPAIAEALECLAGNGYVEESILPRLYREAPLNSIWEGSGNVICLDVLRALHKEPQSRDALIAELRLARGADRRLDAALDEVEAQLAKPEERGARRLVESLAVALQASLLARHSPRAVADAFCATRVAGDHGYAFGTLPAGLDVEGILGRAWPG